MENTNENNSLLRNKVTTSKQFGSMLVYISKVFFKKPSTYIVFGIFSIVILVASLIAPIYNKVNNDQNYTFELVMIIISISLVTLESAIISIIKTCSIFLDTQDEGFEIIIVSKPISRNTIFFSRLLFLMLFGLFVSIFNMLILVISCSISENTFIDMYKGAIIGGSLGTQLLTFSLFFGLTLIFGLLIGAKIGRIIPTVIFIASFIGNNIISSMGQAFAKNPISKINEKLSNNVNKKIKDMGGFNYESEKVTYIDFENTFRVSNNWIYFNQIDLLVGKDKWGSDKWMTINDSNLENNQTNLEIVESIFEELHNISSVNGSIPIIAATYLNPMSAIMNISSTNNLNYASSMEKDDLDIMYKYTNLAPKLPNGKYYQIVPSTNWWGEDEILYASSYSLSKQDPAWALALMWGAIILTLATCSYLVYIRRDFK